MRGGGQRMGALIFATSKKVKITVRSLHHGSSFLHRDVLSQNYNVWQYPYLACTERSHGFAGMTS
jgi:hypothetical protein